MTTKIEYDLLPRAFAEALLSGGDERLSVQEDGLNKYGCAPRPRAAVELGSCTSSTLTERGHREAYSLWRQLCACDGPPEREQLISEAFAGVRRRLLEWLELGPTEVTVALSPSGTDAELLALHLVLGAGRGRLTNVVVAPGEVGSGTLNAAGCLHFAALTPSGEASTAGVPICEELAARVTTAQVEARDPQGEVVAAPEVERQLLEIAQRSEEEGGLTLLHAVAHSKTGIRVPRAAALQRLQEVGKSVYVLVDGAQGRLCKETIRRHLRHGRMVLFTGSKFFGGPTFSGALFVPKTLSESGNRPMPDGFRAYFTAPELPEEWPLARASLGDRANVGLLLRWHAALHEMYAFDVVSLEEQRDVIQSFAQAVEETFSACDWIGLVPAESSGEDELLPTVSPLEEFTTVFNFTVQDERGQPLPKGVLSRWHGWLNRSLSEFLSPQLDDEQRRISDREFHLGQPVMISPGSRASQIAVLRIALGGPLLIDLAHRGSAAKMALLRGMLVDLREKLGIIRTFQSELGLA